MRNKKHTIESVLSLLASAAKIELLIDPISSAMSTEFKEF
jgi:hypothetical protein